MEARQKHKHSNHKKEPKGVSHILSSAFFSSLISLIAFLLLALLLSTVLINTPDPLSLIFPVSLSAVFLCSFLSGMLCIIRVRQRVLFCGLLSGALFLILYTLLTLFLPKGFSRELSFSISLLLRLAMIAFSVLGAYLTSKLFSKRRKRRK